jgi:methionyl-tRNA formyltransferase
MLFGVKMLQQDSNFILEKQSVLAKDALRCYPRRPEDGKIDWQKANSDILRLINASSEPYSGAFTFLNGKKINILRARLYEDNEVYCAIPGQIAKILPLEEKVIVICGEGKLILDLIKWAEDMSFMELFKSVRFRLG